MLTEEQVNENAKTYMRQFFQIVDKDRTEVVLQSEWFGKFGLSDVIDLTSRFTVAQMLAREDFAKRYGSQQPIAITEFLYPLLQGYDSVAIRSDVEFGGMDQKFNCLVGRDLQELQGQRPQQVFMLPLLLGTDGRKMSQSYGNYIAFEAPPNSMYGKVMSIPDAVMMDYMELLTDVPDEDLAEYRRLLADNGINPMDVKHRLAGEIVTQFYSAEAARDAETEFRYVVQGQGMPEDIPTLQWPEISGFVQNLRNVVAHADSCGFDLTPAQMADFLSFCQLAQSKGEARRLISQGAVEIDGVRVEQNAVPVRDNSVIQVGKRRYVKLVR